MTTADDTLLLSSRTRRPLRTHRTWTWVWLLAAMAALLAVHSALVALLMLGAGLVAGGTAVHRDARDALDRGLARAARGAGAALLVSAALWELWPLVTEVLGTLE